MAQLPDDILLIIFEYLDSDSLWIAMSVCNRWTEIIKNSSKILSKLVLKVTPNELSPTTDFCFTGLSIEDFKAEHLYTSSNQFQKLKEILQECQSSIKFLRFRNVHFDAVNEITAILKDLTAISSVEIEKCMINISPIYLHLPKIPTLKSVHINESDDFFEAFNRNDSIEEISMTRIIFDDYLRLYDFINLVENLPNLKHIAMNGYGIGRHLYSTKYPERLSKIERSKFFYYKMFAGSWRLYKILEFIIDDLKLEKFYYGNIPFILNGQKQHVEEIEVQEFEIYSLCELFEQFPTIKRLKINLSEINMYKGSGGLNSRFKCQKKSLFENKDVEELSIYDDGNKKLHLYIGIFKIFKNINCLKLSTTDKAINTVLRECLPEMTQLKEIYLDTNAPKVTERFKVIKKFVPNLKKLSVSAEFLEEAREYFGNDVEIFGINDSRFGNTSGDSWEQVFTLTKKINKFSKERKSLKNQKTSL